MKIKFKLVGGFAVLAATLVLSSCVSDPDSAGLEYMPDMYRSAAIEPYVDYGQIKERINPELNGRLSAMTPPFGTIPYMGTDAGSVSIMMPYDRKPTEAFKLTHGLFGLEYSSQDEYAAAVADKNPMAITADNIDAVMDHGKGLYGTYCLHCHGEKGDGKGPMVESGAYAGVADYANVKNLSDGQLFYSIYYGKGAMGAHGSLLNKKEIWTLVHYIRKFQDADYGSNLSSNNEVAKVEVIEDWSSIDVASMKGHHLKLNVLFNSGSAEIKLKESEASLNGVLAFLNANPGVQVQFAGHTDSDGDDAMNMDISEKRALAVKAWFVNSGINADRIDAVGYGETQLIMIDGKEDHKASRRTELIIK